MSTPPSRWIEHAREDGTDVLYLQGAWRLASVPALVAQIGALPALPQHRCVIDGSRLQALDTAAGFMLYSHLCRLGLAPGDVALRGMDERHARLLALVHERMAAPAAAATTARRALVPHVGAATLRVLHLLLTHNAFVGQVTHELAALVRRPRLFRFRETVSQFEAVVLDGIPIVALVTFLIGVVFAYLLGLQAQQFGASIFVVDGVGLAICRELSPILVAVIVAGRSGAAFTAQIGAMKVQEETDAIATLGLSPIQVLVVPRMVAIVCGLPLLVFVGDVAGIGGGVLICATQLDISPATFIDRLHATLDLSAFVVGVAKAPVFALFIAMIACRMGLSVERDARSVGEHTTSTVVQSIVWVIVLDALFAVVLQRLDL
jgi:phospholipid/cholesterol/gamma-HCH transport system permease protein